MLRLHGLRFENDGKRIVYDYSYDGALSKYFNKNEVFFAEYDLDVSQIPTGIAVIPFLANFTPISWFAGFDIEIPEADATFLDSLESLKSEFFAHFKQIKFDSNVICKNSVRNKLDGNQTALLFSGGLDAFEALTRNIDENPFLVSVWGADVSLDDEKRWDEFQRYNAEEEIINDDRVQYVKSNLRTFYTHHVDLLADMSWWGKVQHGMALISLIAPLSHIFGIRTVLIASSNTGEVSFGWGSTSETDEKVKWADMKVIHDGFQFRRTEKIENIVAFAHKTGHKAQLRVCYHEPRKGKNCSRCPKCQRTMLGFVLCGENPNEYGFEMPSDFYDLLASNFENQPVMTTGVAYEWRCLQEKSRQTTKLFFLENPETEKNNIATFTALRLDEVVKKDVESQSRVKKFKFIIISKFPRLFEWYLKFRRA
ncbi:MAG: hypothetical protein EOO50_13885 [Flavobacterium sp.]|uniref:hypothetical protein n=1 Tax=Flavobacterium sp. TaxID=239 RepID=UPI00121630B8|nr:hypothetical protein [Flavobacterium sp.]RZJ65408.1 MAG: hypothetical protein EOO50_13885 [Flavobacterium sp.]